MHLYIRLDLMCLTSIICLWILHITLFLHRPFPIKLGMSFRMVETFTYHRLEPIFVSIGQSHVAYGNTIKDTSPVWHECVVQEGLTWVWGQHRHAGLHVWREGRFDVLTGGQVGGDSAARGHGGRGVPRDRRVGVVTHWSRRLEKQTNK